MGGETALLCYDQEANQGLSPRGRGNPSRKMLQPNPGRSIPAWAGKPSGLLPLLIGDTVYPRVGGETTSGPLDSTSPTGLSPRGRGNLKEGAITQPVDWVYPRVGGETMVGPRRTMQEHGLSPRGRGNLRCNTLPAEMRRSIPAWAGKPGDVAIGYASAGVYPRVGGETYSRWGTETDAKGLSPRGRGNPDEA